MFPIPDTEPYLCVQYNVLKVFQVYDHQFSI